jgi:hypothetical protein
MDHDERAEGQEFTLTIDRYTRKIAVCEVHEKEIVTPLREMLERLGQQPDEGVRPTARPKGAGKMHAPTDLGVECKFPGCGETSISSAGLTQHLRNRHNKLGVPRYRAFLDGSKPFTDAELEEHSAAPPRTEFYCRVDPEICQNVYTPETSSRPRSSFGNHLRKTHKMSFEEAEAKASSAP